MGTGLSHAPFMISREYDMISREYDMISHEYDMIYLMNTT